MAVANLTATRRHLKAYDPVLQINPFQGIGLAERAWLRATASDPQFREGDQALDDRCGPSLKLASRIAARSSNDMESGQQAYFRKETIMRTILTCAAIAAILVASAQAQQPAAPGKGAVTDEAVIDMVGGRMSKMFSVYGTPEDVWADRGATEAQDDVFFGYGPYGFKVRDKVVRVCFFFRGWEGSIRGIKIGDTREDVVKVLGMPRTTVTDKDGMVTAYGYDLKDLDANFFANFHEDGKVWRVEVSLK